MSNNVQDNYVQLGHQDLIRDILERVLWILQTLILDTIPKPFEKVPSFIPA